MAALFLAREFPLAPVRGVDVSEEMIRRAKAKVGLDPEGRVAFRVADSSSLPYADDAFDLVTLLNMPPFFAEISRVLRHGGHAIVAASSGDRTPFFTPDSVLERGFRRHGMRRSRRGGSAAAPTSWPARGTERVPELRSGPLAYCLLVNPSAGSGRAMKRLRRSAPSSIATACITRS